MPLEYLWDTSREHIWLSTHEIHVLLCLQCVFFANQSDGDNPNPNPTIAITIKIEYMYMYRASCSVVNLPYDSCK
jgi:hypothetical protein